MTYESAIAAVWPSVALVGRAELRRFRLPPETVDDLLQDAAAVVMRRRPHFADGNDLAPYVRVVVRRLAYRWIERRNRESLGAVPDRPAIHSVAELAEHRLRLRGAVKAFAELPTHQKGRLQTYLAATDRGGDARERARERKQIERIRMAMSRVAEGFAAAIGWVRYRLRWLEPGAPQLAGLAFAVGGVVAMWLPQIAGLGPHAGTADDETVELTMQLAADAGLRTSELAGGAHHDHAPPGTAPTRAATPRSRTTEVMRIETPVGPPATWSTTHDPDNTAVLCVGTRYTGRNCVDNPLPDLPVLGETVPM